MRCFVAVTVGPSITDALAAEVAALHAEAERCGLKATWSRPEGWHATVKFLGEIDSERAANVAARLPEAAVGVAPFAVEATGVMTLPERARTPNVLAVTLSDGEGCFAALARRVDEVLSAQGFDRESRAFRPHLTLARIRAPHGWRDFRAAAQALRKRSFGTAEVNAITLFSSTLGAGPARYEPIAKVELGTGSASRAADAAVNAGEQRGAADPGVETQHAAPHGAPMGARTRP